MERRRAVAVVGTLLLVACTRAPEGPARAAPSIDTLPGAVTGERLLVLTGDRSVITVSPDGEDRRLLMRGGDGEVEVTQPVWSPDGRSVAWVAVDVGGGPPAVSRVVTSRPDGTGRRGVEVDATAFFLQWDPTSSRIAYLGGFRGAIGMGVVDLEADDGPTATALGVAQPFYVSWNPAGDRLLVHAGNTLGTVDLDANLDDLGERAGLFHAPVWLADGRLVYATVRGTKQQLVLRDGDRSERLLPFEGAIEFVASPDGARLAYRVDTPDEGLGTVRVVDVASGRTRTVLDEAASAFHWSPDGTRLLVMTPIVAEERLTHRWWLWNGERAVEVGVPFVPSETYLREYLPFFGQYAQTMTPWSPDGRSFAFSGAIEGREGIWVEGVRDDEPRLVLEGGSVVAWSPASA